MGSAARNGKDETGFQVPADELAGVLEVLADELVEAIESDEVVYREMGANDGELVVELEVLGKRCRLKIVGQK